jgi:transcription antitermination factor NusG
MLTSDDDTKRGNMARVYLDLAREAEESVRRIDERQGPFHAEIVEGCEPSWHVLKVAPTHDNIAAGHLVARRFGVFVPTFLEEKSERGTVRRRRMLLLPGYVFLFVWNLKRHMRRVLSCPGVSGILLAGAEPAIVPDKMIDALQAREFEKEGYRFKAVRKRRRNRGRAAEASDDNGKLVISITAYSALDGIEQLGEAQRLDAFHKAMGLAA